MELQMHQKAKAAWQSKYGYYKFRWGCKKRFEKNQLFSRLLEEKWKGTDRKINKGEALVQAAKVSSKTMLNGVCSARYEEIKGSVATAQARRILQTEFKSSAPCDKQIEINK